MSIRQREGESLHVYLSYFNMAIQELCNLDQSMTMIAMKSGLQKNTFLFFLEKTYPQNFIEMLIRVEKYANTEEVYNAHLVPANPKVE